MGDGDIPGIVGGQNQKDFQDRQPLPVLEKNKNLRVSCW